MSLSEVALKLDRLPSWKAGDMSNESSGVDHLTTAWATTGEVRLGWNSARVTREKLISANENWPQ